MTPRFVWVLIVAAAIATVMIGWQTDDWGFVLKFMVLGAVGGLLPGAFIGMICGKQCHKTMSGCGSGSLGGVLGGIVMAIVSASLPIHSEHTEWGTQSTPVMFEGIWLPVTLPLFICFSGYFAWTRAKWSLSLPEK